MDTEKLREKIANIKMGKCVDGCKYKIEDENGLSCSNHPDTLCPHEIDKIIQAFKEYLLEKAGTYTVINPFTGETMKDIIVEYAIQQLANSLTPDTVCPQCNRTWFSNAVPEVCDCGRGLR